MLNRPILVRERLPERREGHTLKLEWRLMGGHDIHLYASVGYYDDGRVGEVWGDTAKSGTDMEALISDGCILMSLALQHGIPLAAIAEALGENRAEGAHAGPPASPLGMLAREALKLEEEMRA
jgi:hypothetical protein